MKKTVCLTILLLFGSTVEAVDINMSQIGLQRMGPDRLRLRNIDVPGQGNYYADFVWDSENNRLEILNAAPDHVDAFSVTRRAVSATQDSVSNFDQVCRQEFGPDSRQADWSGLKAALANDDLALRAFIESNRLVSGTFYFVTYGMSPLQSYNGHGLPYFASLGGNSGVTKENLAGGVMRLAYTSSTINGQVICSNLAETASPFK
ncbi:MAG: hypothetical protein Q7U38_02055 [Methylobacter sp.]|jgi:hypothetical protein|nr:hypothetical protein [Methylobacter sp.]MDP2100010.1 hypothetical protein [Methylobacter sp.]MDP2427544.1 hypothetical protein [Methylobacter sp.]MDP3054526.1 hypothetical protein [Methylobacter sp.]MDP3362616.1 hypothetical protein [Methylobacter sp.]